jgi:Recombination endonuclease VII
VPTKTSDEETKPAQRMALCHPARVHYALNQCKPCHLRNWQSRNKDRVNAYARRHNIQVIYGITWEEYEALLKKQDGKCAICRVPFISHSHYRGTRIDHVPGTKIVRGLLCHGCNIFVGYLEKRKELFPTAMAYVWSSDRERDG